MNDLVQHQEVPVDPTQHLGQEQHKEANQKQQPKKDPAAPLPLP